MTFPSDRWLAPLGGMLLGVASVCFAVITPLPALIRLPPFPGGTPVALVSGGICLIGSVLCLLLGQWREHRATIHQQTEEEQAYTAEQHAALQEETVERYPDLTSPSEVERFPLWFLRAIHDHTLAGRETAARCLLEEWRDAPSRTQAHRKSLDRYVCHLCGLPSCPSLLLICTRCQQFAHKRCSALVRRVSEDGGTLTVDPTIRPFCRACLDTLQTQGWTLAQDGDHFLLIRQKPSPNDR